MFNRLVAGLIFLAPLAVACQSTGVTAARPAEPNSEAASSSQMPPSAGRNSNAKTAVRGPSRKQKLDAEEVYLKGARFFARGSSKKAQEYFEKAVDLNPENSTYVLALLYSREATVNQLVREALKARLRGDSAGAQAFLRSASNLDPTNSLVLQYLSKVDLPLTVRPKEQRTPREFESPMILEPFAGVRTFHMHGDVRQVVSDIYNAFGILSVFDPSVPGGDLLRIDLESVAFGDVVRVLKKAAHIFPAPINTTSALIATDTKELRETLNPLVEETIYLSGKTQQQMLDYANMARTVFDLTQLAVNTSTGAIVVRGPEAAVHQTHDLFAELSSETSDLLLEINVYEVDKSTTRKIGFAPPTTASAIDVASTAQKLISDNQSLLNSSISSGALTLSGTTYEQELEEVSFLVAAGVSGSSSLTSILGTVGSFDGVPLLGITMGSTSLNLLLNTSETRLFNAFQVRSSDQQEVTFRVGSRYPIMTALTTSASSSAVASQLSAAGVSNSVITALTGSGSSAGTSTPQIQFEDIGLTLKVTPRVLRDGQVQLALDFTLESLGKTGIESIPVLNNRALKSAVTISLGETTMLASLISANELKALDGVSGLDGLPGFQSTNRDTDGNKNGLLITVTPRTVSGAMMRADRHRAADAR